MKKGYFVCYRYFLGFKLQFINSHDSVGQLASSAGFTWAY